MSADYKHLRADKLIETADRLASRIVGRFPEASLGKVAVSVAEVVRNAVATAEKINQPNWWIRGGLIGAAALVVIMAVLIAFALRDQTDTLLRVLEPLRLAPLYLGAIVVFFWTLETRYKRGKAVKAIHELRGLAHIIDMHQLTKDPECSPESDPAYNREGVCHYLNYCSEMLALLSKIGQLYVEDFPDGTTLAAVDQLENLTTGLSQKIWQKVMILDPARCEVGAGK